MTARTLLISGAAGLLGGIAAGIVIFRGDDAAPRAGPQAKAIAGQTSAPRVAQHLAFPGDDERITRVFSALQQRVQLRQRLELSEAMQDLTAEEIPRLMKHAESLGNATASDLVSALAERWFELDPAGAQAWALSSSMEFGTIKAWGHADPEGAIRAALTSKEWWASSLLFNALDALYGDDGAAMKARVQTFPAGAMRDYAVAVVLYQWAEHDPAAAFAALAELPPGRKRDELRNNLLEQSANRDPGWTLARLGEILPTLKAGVLGHELVTRIAEQIARTDARLVLDWLSGIPPEFRTPPAIAAAREWAKKEPLAAIEWCMANGVDVAQANWRDSARRGPAVLAGAMESAPEETFARLAVMPPGTERDRLLECAFMEGLWHTPGKQIFGDDCAMAWRLYTALPEDAQIVKAWLFGQRRAEYADLEDPGAWVRDFPPGLARSNAIAGAIAATRQRDGTRAEEFLSKMNPGPDRDAALRGIATSQPACVVAADRALEIGDTTVRRDTLEALVLPWLKNDSETSRAWLQAATIPEPWKQEWLRESAGIK